MEFSAEIVPKDPLWKIDLVARILAGMGISGVWLSEHTHNRSSFITASHLLRSVGRIWIGVGVINPYTINPFVIAQLTASLTEIGPGRVRIALGAGDKTALESIGVERAKPLERVRQAVAVVKQILRERRFAAENVSGRIDFNPRSYAPVYVGAQGPKMLRLAGEVGDGVLVNYSDLDDLRWAYTIVAEGITESGRRLEDVDVAAYLTISVDEDIDKAAKTAAPYAAYILCGLPDHLVEKLDLKEESLRKISEAVKRADWPALYEVLTLDLIKRFAIVCRPSSLRALLEEVLEIGYRQIVLGAPLGPRFLRSLREICRAVRELSGS